MSLRSKILTFTAAAFIAGTFAVTGSAQTEGEGNKTVKRSERKADKGARSGAFGKGFRGGARHRRGGFHLRGIELTDAQKVQINAIREANKPDEGLRQEMMSIMQARRAGTLTEAQKERAQAIRDIQKVRAEGIKAQIEAILTPEQKQTLETRRHEMQKRMEERRQRMTERRLQRQQRKEDGEKPAGN